MKLVYIYATGSHESSAASYRLLTQNKVSPRQCSHLPHTLCHGCSGICITNQSFPNGKLHLQHWLWCMLTLQQGLGLHNTAVLWAVSGEVLWKHQWATHTHPSCTAVHADCISWEALYILSAAFGIVSFAFRRHKMMKGSLDVLPELSFFCAAVRGARATMEECHNREWKKNCRIFPVLHLFLQWCLWWSNTLGPWHEVSTLTCISYYPCIYIETSGAFLEAIVSKINWVLGHLLMWK